MSVVLFCIVFLERLTKPFGHGGLGERHPCRRRSGQAYLTAVRDIAVTVPAGLFGTLLDLHGADTAGVDELLVELSVTAHTVLVDDSLALGDGLHRLRFGPHGEDIRVAETILGLEEVLVEDRSVWHVTVVARSVEGVRAVVPSRVERLHDVTVDTHRRLIAEIAICLRHIDEIGHQPHSHTCT